MCVGFRYRAHHKDKQRDAAYLAYIVGEVREISFSFLFYFFNFFFLFFSFSVMNFVLLAIMTSFRVCMADVGPICGRPEPYWNTLKDGLLFAKIPLLIVGSRFLSLARDSLTRLNSQSTSCHCCEIS
jgi:hypothetical protein